MFRKKQSICRVSYYLRFQASTKGFRKYLPQIRGICLCFLCLFEKGICWSLFLCHSQPVFLFTLQGSMYDFIQAESLNCHVHSENLKFPLSVPISYPGFSLLYDYITIYPFASWWTFSLFPVFCYYECFYKYSVCSLVCLTKRFSRVNT